MGACPEEAPALEPASACPAAILGSVWALRGPASTSSGTRVALPPKAAEALGGRKAAVNGDASIGVFSLCARIRCIRGGGPSGSPCRIAGIGDPPSKGWQLTARPVIGFSSAGRQAPTGQEEKSSNDGGAEADGVGQVAQRGADDVGSTAVDDGEWHHIAAAYGSSEGLHPHVSDGIRRLAVWVDGRLDGEAFVKIAPALGDGLDIGDPERKEEPKEAPVVEPVKGGKAKANQPPPVEEAPKKEEPAVPAIEVADVEVFAHVLSNTQARDLAARSRVLPTGVSLPLLPWQVADLWQLQANPQEADAERNLPGKAAVRRMVEEALCLGTPGSAFQDEVICDFFVRFLIFCYRICLTARKASIALAIMSEILAMMYRRSESKYCVGDPATVTECFAEYRRLLIAHSQAVLAPQRASGEGARPGSEAATSRSRQLPVFSVGEARQLTEYLSGALFQHFILYQCVLVKPQASVMTCFEVSLERPRPAPALRSGKQMPKGSLSPRARGQQAMPLARAGSIASASLLGSVGGHAAPEDEDGEADAGASRHRLQEDLEELEEPSAEDLEGLLAFQSSRVERKLREQIQERDKAFFGKGS